MIFVGGVVILVSLGPVISDGVGEHVSSGVNGATSDGLCDGYIRSDEVRKNLICIMPFVILSRSLPAPWLPTSSASSERLCPRRKTCRRIRRLREFRGRDERRCRSPRRCPEEEEEEIEEGEEIAGAGKLKQF